VPNESQRPDEEVAREILRYFLRHPEAADSLAGIARWRLMQESVRHSVEKTGEALRWLIDEGYMREETRLATGQIFQLNSARRKAAEEFLRQGRRGADRRGAERRVAQKAGRGRSET
jgi:hypothetical protein